MEPDKNSAPERNHSGHEELIELQRNFPSTENQSEKTDNSPVSAETKFPWWFGWLIVLTLVGSMVALIVMIHRTR
ncbi:hypothetical protein ABDK56_11050 [Sphingomonas sp. ASV193]|uniref:hypothetical protein n=1 Tax=Sphingomonas sp. ASV193 TaxID=3144405 RepID=UPI0032E93633